MVGSSDVPRNVSADGRTARAVDYRGTTSPVVSDRIQANVEAIELARQIISENRYATGEEQEILARFSGWGGLQEFFTTARDNSDDERVQRVQDLLGDEGFAEARRGLLTQHFTPSPVTGEIWGALENLGFEGGRVLEPGSGLGSFIATAPDGAHMTGVELDSTTATISSLLYPSHEIRNEGYQDHQIEGTELYDAVVGNVPFGQIRLTGDKDPFPYEGSIHNYFIQKALWQTRPGGIVAVLSSTYTMDAKNPALRRLIYSPTSEGGLDADLLGAVRLPNGVFSQTANTEVASDILLFRRRLPGEDALPFDWEYATSMSLDGNDFTVNAYWNEHRDNVLGDFVVGSNQYGPALNVQGETNAQALASGELRERLTRIVDEARSRGRAMSERREDVIRELPRVEIDKNRVGRLRINKDSGKVEALNQYGDWVEKNKINADGTESKKPLAEKDIPQLRALLDLRDKASELIATEAATTGYVPELENMRNDVRDSYRAYVQTYKCIGDQEIRETYKKDKTGEPVLDDEGNPIIAKIKIHSSEAIKIFRTDPDFATVFALEKYNSETNTAVEADILSRRTIRVEPKPLGVDNAQDAMRVSITERGRIDIDYMSFLLGEKNTEKVEQELEGLAFRDPEKNGEWVSRAEYLSGNVRKKLVRAEEVAHTDEAYNVNAAALREVQPKDVPLTDVTIVPGAVWIPVADHLEFFREVMLGHPSDDRAKLSFNPVSNTWNCSGGSAANAVWSPANPEHAWKFAADKAPSEVFKRTLNNSFEIMVERDGQKIVDRDASQQMKDAAERCKVEFNNWLWRDPNRVERLTRSYNDMFNSLVPRNYEAEGQALRLPGLSEAYKPHPWQKTAVARILAEPSTGL
ncbi:MAG: hypothetical protein IKZ87_04305, partial [Actinomycetaceae bacterium]|nr:hypothetical protein [Actinomycetaceae bacterium]